jgi:hypothetical protein
MFTLFTLQVKGIILEVFTYKFRLCVGAKTKKVEHALTAHTLTLSLLTQTRLLIPWVLPHDLSPASPTLYVSTNSSIQPLPKKHDASPQIHSISASHHPLPISLG